MPSPSKKTVERWNSQLRAFRFFYAHGGHANDMDTLSARFRFTPGVHGLEELFKKLELPLVRIPSGAPRIEGGRMYSADEWKTLPTPIRDYPDYAEVGITKLFSMPVCLTIHAHWASLTVAGARGNFWEVTEDDFRNALRLEAKFAELGIEFIVD